MLYKEPLESINILLMMMIALHYPPLVGALTVSCYALPRGSKLYPPMIMITHSSASFRQVEIELTPCVMTISLPAFAAAAVIVPFSPLHFCCLPTLVPCSHWRLQELSADS